MTQNTRIERNRIAKRRAVLFGVSTVVIFVALMSGLWVMRGVELDSQGCPKEQGPTREVVLIIDTSDPLNDKHRAELERIMREMTEPGTSGRHDRLAIREGERLNIYRLGGTEDPTTPITEICNPGGNPQERGFIDDLTTGKLITKWRWEQFVEVTQDLFPDEESEAHPTSPILETIAVISARHAPSSRAEDDVEPTHLIVISDLLQHTDKLSQYSSYPAPNTLRGELSTDLSKVVVSLFRLERDKYREYQTPEHYYWWADWVVAMGGKVVWQQDL